MSTKMNSQPGGRRPPLSLGGGSGGGQKYHQQSSGGTNGNSFPSSQAKLSQKNEQSSNDRKDAVNSAKESKKQQLPNNETKKEDEKKVQHGAVKNNGTGKVITNNVAKDNNKEKIEKVVPKEENKVKEKKADKEVVSKIPVAKETVDKKPKPNTDNKKEVEKEVVQKQDSKNKKDSEKDVIPTKHELKEKKDNEKVVDNNSKSDGHKVGDKQEKKVDKQGAKVQKQQEDQPVKQIDVDNSATNVIVNVATSRNTTSNDANSPSLKTTPTQKSNKTPTSSPTTKTMIGTEDVEMEPLTSEKTPIKLQQSATPVATSTPGRILGITKPIVTEVPLTYSGSSPDRNNCPRSLSQISGRRSIRPLNEYTPSKFQSNLQFRESYRRITTDLDLSSTTNTSLNVTVGSEIPNNSSFSFFGRSRKRDRTPPASQSAMQLQTDIDISSPPKRARLDMHGFFSAVASPLTMLRSRFSKASIQSSTPVKLRLEQTPPPSSDDVVEVQNVSGIVVEDEIQPKSVVSTPQKSTEDVTVGTEAGLETPKKGSPVKLDGDSESEPQLDVEAAKCGLDVSISDMVAAENSNGDIKITETLVGDSAARKRCSIM